MASKRIKEINKNLGKSSTAFKSFSSKASSAVRRVRMELNKIGSLLKRMPTWAKIASAAFVFYIGKKAVTSIIEVGAQYERLHNRILIASRGIREDADKTWAKVLEFAAKSPLMTEPVVAAFATLKAAGVDSAFEVTKSLSGLALMFNRQVDDLAGMFLGALQRVFRRMGIIIDRSGKKAVISTAAWTVTVAKDIRSIWKGLAEVIDKSFGNALDTMRNTWAGLVFELLGKWDVFKNTIAQSGILDSLKAALKTANKWFDELSDTGRLDKWAKSTSDAMVTVLEVVIGIVAQFGYLEEAFIRLKIVGETVDPGKFAIRSEIAKYNKQLERTTLMYEELAEQIARVEKEGGEITKRSILEAMPKGMTREIELFGRDFKDIWQSNTFTLEEAKNMLHKMGVEQVGLNAKIQIMSGFTKERGDLQRDLLEAEKRTKGILTEANELINRYKKTLKDILESRKQGTAEVNNIRRMDEIRNRADFLHKQATEEINSLLKQQKQIRESLLGMSDEEMAKLQWFINNRKKIMEEPGKFRGAEILGLAKRFEGLAGGRGGSQELFEALFKQHIKPISEAINAAIGAPSGGLWITRELEMARGRQATSMQRATEERFETERAERMAKITLNIAPRFDNDFRIAVTPDAKATAIKLIEIANMEMNRVIEELKDERRDERMSLRAAGAEADSLVGEQ